LLHQALLEHSFLHINRAWKDDNTWFGEYVGNYVQATLGGATNEQAHEIGRAAAETGRFEPGSDGFNNAFNKNAQTQSYLNYFLTFFKKFLLNFFLVFFNKKITQNLTSKLQQNFNTYK